MIRYIDFEYKFNPKKNFFNLKCGVIKNGSAKPLRFDLRRSQKELIDYITTNTEEDDIWVAYNVAGAEAKVMTQLMGIEFMLKTKWICLLNEFRMLALTHPQYTNPKTNLATCMETFKISDQYAAQKSATLNLIMSKDEYTDAEFEQIINYCEEDVKILPIIAVKIHEATSKYGCTLAHRLERGRYSRNVAISQMVSKGFPMNKPLTKAVFQNIPHLKNALALLCNQQTGHQIYKPKLRGREPNKEVIGYSFNFEAFEDYLGEKGLLQIWKRTETDRLSTKEDYLDEMVSAYKVTIEPVYMARNSLKQLSSTDLTTLMDDEGYIHPEYAPYCQKTSRTSPYPSQGFVMNLCPWLRMLVKPPQGRALISIDYKSQEVLVAAALSKDYSMLEDYLTDIYIGQAVKTGFLPAESSKKTHKKERTAFKQIVLGTSYGMEAKSLSIRFFNFWKELGVIKNIKDCYDDAKNFLKEHEIAYKEYHRFLHSNEKMAIVHKYLIISDHWYYFTTFKTKPNAIKNAPVQGTAAEMLRQASNSCLEKYQIATTPHHDSLLVECAFPDATRIAKIVSFEMVQASIQVLGEEFGKYMNTETKIFDEHTPYYDDRGEKMFRTISKELNFPCYETFPQAPEFLDIHK